MIDDEEIIRVTARTILAELGYEVLMAKNGQEGVEVFRKECHRINMVLLDMIMPEMNGGECFRQLQKIEPGVAVVLASGFSPEDDLKHMQEAGLKGFIRKPYRTSELSVVVAEAMKN